MDIEKFTDPVKKLVEVVSDAVGVLYEPRRIERKARAEANSEIYKKLGELVSKELDERTLKRIVRKENNRQINIEAIFELAVHEIGGQDNISDDDVDPDWITDFFNLCQDISNEDLQLIWARLLASEVSKPGSFHKRTLHELRMMSSIEANWFNSFCENVVEISTHVSFEMVYNSMIVQFIPLKEGSVAMDYAKISSYQLYRLEEIGLINSTTFSLEDSDEYYLRSGDVIFETYAGIDYSIETYALTLVGEDLYTAISVNPNTEYINICTNHLSERGAIKKVQP